MQETPEHCHKNEDEEMMDILEALEYVSLLLPSENQSCCSKMKGADLSFFQFFIKYHHDKLINIQKQHDLDTDVPNHFRSYPSPDWVTRRHTYTPLSLLLTPDLIYDPEVECAFHKALFRVRLVPRTFKRRMELFATILPGTILTFEGYQTSYGHHVVEWCQYVQGNTAYLRVIGRNTKDRTPFPFNHPHFLTFILEIPSYLQTVDKPPELRSQKLPMFKRILLKLANSKESVTHDVIEFRSHPDMLLSDL